ncbi:hypothetical protein CTI12_AA465650 [Artemisia annua]|uniref:Homologous recombination OB-fold protein OB-fold domain-containing protein n=1 Tax=Artemisia annua TaxID=35608 RepID=A0A2U1LQF3_ARTAN|nr:hypothetical protein CTI12_AA465650 [Artemisia annua]
MDQTWIIPGPAGILQAAKLRKFKDITEGSSIMPTQDYVQKVIEDASEDNHFSRGPWLSALEYWGAFGIESCSPNILGDLIVTLKDPSRIMSSTIHHKVLDEKKGYAKMIGVGAVLILKNISVFTPKAHHHYLNITLKNMVEVFQNHTVY